jgi:thioredoxin reductase
MTSMTTRTSLLVVGAGPYGLSTAAYARDRGIDTVVTGRPMGFWREHMPERMFLRSGPDWHLDAAGVHTFQAYLEERGISPEPIPLAVFLEYAEWYRRAKGIEPLEDLVEDLAQVDGHFEARLSGGQRVEADAVVVAPGVAHFTTVPAWADAVPAERATHTCDLVRFDDLAGARVLIVGGRQSAYEWAALLADQGAERVDVVHRHDVPRFDRVSWRFVDGHVASTLRTKGWWRSLPKAEQDAIARQFWEVGRLTLEAWLTPRLPDRVVHRWPGCEVVSADDESGVLLSNGERLEVDHIVFATGYRADLRRVPYLNGLAAQITVTDGFPALDEGFGTSVPGLYATGFCATRDFGPFFGFVKAAPAAATLTVHDLLARRG